MPKSAEEQARIDREFERLSSELDSAEAQSRLEGPIIRDLRIASRRHQQFLALSWEAAKDRVIC